MVAVFTATGKLLFSTDQPESGRRTPLPSLPVAPRQTTPETAREPGSAILLTEKTVLDDEVKEAETKQTTLEPSWVKPTSYRPISDKLQIIKKDRAKSEGDIPVAMAKGFNGSYPALDYLNLGLTQRKGMQTGGLYTTDSGGTSEMAAATAGRRGVTDIAILQEALIPDLPEYIQKLGHQAIEPEENARFIALVTAYYEYLKKLWLAQEKYCSADMDHLVFVFQEEGAEIRVEIARGEVVMPELADSSKVWQGVRLYQEGRSSVGEITIDNTEPLALPRSAKSLLLASSFVVGAGAASKALIGSYQFGKIIGLPAAGAWSLGVISALPAIFFYQRSIEPISLELITRLSKLRKESSIATFQIHQASQYARRYKDLSSEGSFKHIIDIFLGIGYGTANVGMVLANFPAALNHPGLKGILAACLAMTNLSVGVHKSRKVTSDMQVWMANFEIAVSETRLLCNALRHYEKLNRIYRKKYNPIIQNFERGMFLKKLAEKANNTEDALDLITKEISRLQIQIDEVSKPAPRGSENKSYEPLPAAEAPSAHAARYQARAVFYGQAPVTEACTAVISAVTAGAAVVSNIGGIAAFAHPIANIGGLTASISPVVPVMVAYSLAVLGSTSAYGLNKIDTDKWRDAFLAKVSNDALKAEFGDKPETTATNVISYIWSAFVSAAKKNGLGYFLSFLAASNGVYYTKAALDNMPFIKSAEGTIGYLVKACEYYSLSATGLLMTTTKGKPTADLLRKAFAMLSSIRGQTQAAGVHYLCHKEEVAFLNSQIEITLKAIAELFGQFTQAFAHFECSKWQSARALPLQPVTYATYSEKLNAAIASLVASKDGQDAIHQVTIIDQCVFARDLARFMQGKPTQKRAVMKIPSMTPGGPADIEAGFSGGMLECKASEASTDHRQTPSTSRHQVLAFLNREFAALRAHVTEINLKVRAKVAEPGAAFLFAQEVAAGRSAPGPYAVLNER